MASSVSPKSERIPRVRTATRQDAVVGELRRRIVSGEFLPGSRLPNRRDLVPSLGVSGMTLQRALETLSGEGFITSIPTQGTYVSRTPPHLARFALIFSCLPKSGGAWGGFWQAVANAATRLRQSDGLDIEFYYGTEDDSASPSFTRLLVDARLHRLAGLLFVQPPEVYARTGLLDHGLPLISLSGSPTPGVVNVVPDLASFVSRAVERLAQEGCRHVALIGQHRCIANPAVRQAFHSALAAHGCIPHLAWELSADLESPGSATNLVRLLMAADGRQRPDGLIVADDNFGPAALAGLVAERHLDGARPRVLVHGNFPLAKPSMAGVIHLGFDVADLLRRSVATAIAQRVNGQPPADVRVAAVFAEEWAEKKAATE